MNNPRVTFVLPPFVHLLDLAGPMQVFQEAGMYGQPYDIRWCCYERDFTSSVGLGFAESAWFEDVTLESGEYVFIPGVLSSHLHSTPVAGNKRFYKWLRERYAKGAIVCSVCAGAFTLGYAGLLDGKRCTSHWRLVDDLQRTFPSAHVQPDVLFVNDERIYTSAGISAGIDLALYILEERHGALLAHNVARELVVYHRRSGLQKQTSVYLDYRNHVHVGIHKVQDWIIEHLDTAPSLEQLAEIATMSIRHLTRIFRQVTGISINTYITLIRCEVARGLMNNPEYSMETIAERCGLQSVRQLRRILADNPEAA
ncbi:MAG: GlxA family transcriptional regulator [Candidatus Kapaibacteriota bacterium]